MAAVTLFYTLGYEKSEIADYLCRLQQHHVATVVDVRSMPLSRKRGFSKKALSAHLNEAGIAYIHVPTLGAPKALREELRAGAPWASYAAGYKRLVLAQKKIDVQALAKLASRQTISLLCFERNPAECHRSLLAAEMISLARECPLQVEHIRY